MYCLSDLCRGEGVGVTVEYVLLAYVSKELSGVWVRLAWDWVGKLSAEVVGYFGRFGVDGVVEFDGLVWVLVGAFTGKGTENFPVFTGVTAC